MAPRAQVVRRPGRDRPDVSAFLALFEHKIRDQSRLSLPEVQAIAAYLSTSVAEFAVFSHADAVLKARSYYFKNPTMTLRRGVRACPAPCARGCSIHVPRRAAGAAQQRASVQEHGAVSASLTNLHDMHRAVCRGRVSVERCSVRALHGATQPSTSTAPVLHLLAAAGALGTTPSLHCMWGLSSDPLLILIQP